MISSKEFKWLSKAVSVKGEYVTTTASPWSIDGYVVATDGRRLHALKQPDARPDWTYVHRPDVKWFFPEAHKMDIVTLTRIEKDGEVLHQIADGPYGVADKFLKDALSLKEIPNLIWSESHRNDGPIYVGDLNGSFACIMPRKIG